MTYLRPLIENGIEAYYIIEKYGINENILMWFEDNLNDRNQKVLINGKTSFQKPVSAGVPQGSVLGPLLFLIYINDISDDLTGLAGLFADDTSLSYLSADKHYYNLKQRLTEIKRMGKKMAYYFQSPKN